MQNFFATYKHSRLIMFASRHSFVFWIYDDEQFYTTIKADKDFLAITIQ